MDDDLAGRASTRHLDADFAMWDPGRPQKFAEFAGGKFLHAEGEYAVVTDQAGCELLLRPGSLALRPDGSPDLIFASPENLGGQWSVWETSAR